MNETVGVLASKAVNGKEYTFDHWMELCKKNAIQYFNRTVFGFEVFERCNRIALREAYEEGLRPWNALHRIISNQLTNE